MDTTTLGNWLWEAACSIRGPLDAPKYKDYILPLLFYKRLCDVFDDELDRLAREPGDRTQVRTFVPQEDTWAEVRKSPVRLG